MGNWDRPRTRVPLVEFQAVPSRILECWNILQSPQEPWCVNHGDSVLGTDSALALFPSWVAGLGGPGGLCLMFKS